MIGKYRIRTDLAMENGEKYENDDVELSGVVIRKDYNQEKDVHTTYVQIQTEHGARMMEKPIGTYVTIEAPNLTVLDEEYHREIAGELSEHLRALLPGGDEAAILVIGLGNRDITPDALGPQVVENLQITRHLVKEYGAAALGEKCARKISALVPGVMAQTGMETMEIVRGVVKETNPDVVVVIDALAARSIRRLNCTIQLTDTGISPGSGVGNYRNALNQETLKVPVIGIGVPTVVDAGNIIHVVVVDILI